MSKHAILILQTRQVNIFQRAIIINTIVLAKVWYISHTYPLSESVAKSINKLIFSFLWNFRAEPLKRCTVFKPKDAGGVNMINVHAKALSIFTNSFIKSFLHSTENKSIIKCYCASRLNPLFDIRMLPINMSYISTPYFINIIDLVRKCKRLRHSPNISSKLIYEFLENKSKIVPHWLKQSIPYIIGMTYGPI